MKNKTKYKEDQVEKHGLVSQGAYKTSQDGATHSSIAKTQDQQHAVGKNHHNRTMSLAEATAAQNVTSNLADKSRAAAGEDRQRSQRDNGENLYSQSTR